MRLLEQKQEDEMALKASLPDAEVVEDGNQGVSSAVESSLNWLRT